MVYKWLAAGAGLGSFCWAAVPLAALWIGCGPGHLGTSAGGSADGGVADTGTTGMTVSASGVVSSTTRGTTGSLDSSGSSADSTSTGPSTPIGQDCTDTLFPALPPLQPGCEHVMLVDGKGVVMPDSPSGLVRCEEPNAPKPRPTRPDVFIMYRTAPVACPFATGECLCDADCPGGTQCICENELLAGDGNQCLISDCAAASDCGGQPCRVDVQFCGSYDHPVAIYCTAPGDDCQYHSECIAQGSRYCAYDGLVEMFTCSPGAICE